VVEPLSRGESFNVNPAVQILLVDDEARNLDALESFLQSPEYTLVRALSAEQALLLLLEGEFAVIVLDIKMPGMTGIELADLIKQRKKTQHIPIIFLTAYLQDDKDILEGYGIGAVDYLTKPFNPQILKSKIGVFVELFRKTRALASTNAALELEIKQRQEAEEALRRANNELEARVRERTGDLSRANDELRARERALEASEAQLRLVTDHAPVFIIQLDRQHRFRFVNRTYAWRFGFEPKDVIGRHVTEVMGEGPYSAIRHQIDATLAGQRVEFELEIPYADLGPRWLNVIHEPDRTPDGEVVGIVAVVADITERKLAEQSVASARDQALAASRAKDEFLAALSHELRTPLNPVLLLATESARDPKLRAKVRADFQTIADNVALEARLIDDLLDLTRIARGKLTLERRPCDVHMILGHALAMVREEIDAKQIAVALKFDADRHVVLGDDVRLKQVFWNVIKNAAKFTSEKGRIEVETAIEADGGHFAVRVTDTGRGMTKAELGRIFEPFSQGDHSAEAGTHVFGGLGLGLAISKMMMELHSGSISAASRGRNKGATFVLKFPLMPATESGQFPPADLQPAALTSAAASNGKRRRRILLVEDHKPTAIVLAHLLTQRNYSVVSAGGVAEARAAASRENFELLISDIGLLDGNGYELMSELNGRPGLAGIALTGYGMEEDVSRSRAAGFVAHLTKPVTVQALDGALSEATRRLNGG
jgi:PAS domain S-box-containing protein